MHLLATVPGTIADGSAAVDLAQTPGDIVVLSSADTEIALLAAAQARRRARTRPRRACASRRSCGSATISRSISTWRRSPRRGWSSPACSAAAPIGPTASSGWPRPAAQNGIPLALLPGDDKPDPELAELSTVAARRPASAVALSRRRRRRPTPTISCAMPRSLIGHETKLGRAGAAAARRALLAGPRVAEPRRHRRELARRAAASCRSCSTGRWCSRATRRRSMRWSRALSARRLRPLPIFVAEPQGRRSRGAARRRCSPRCRPR